jgi:hypothetical protein
VSTVTVDCAQSTSCRQKYIKALVVARSKQSREPLVHDARDTESFLPAGFAGARERRLRLGVIG